MKVAILGAGAWGSALTVPLAANGHHITLWCRRSEHSQSLNQERRNDQYLPGISLDFAHATTELAQALSGAQLVIFTVPSGAVRSLCRQVRPHLEGGIVVVSAVKALERQSAKRMSEVMGEELALLAPTQITALSGPNFAVEVARKLPTATVIGGDGEATQVVQRALMTKHLRVYTNPDIAGVELGGALKNVIALAAGIAEGMGLGLNAQASIITRGLAELSRLGTRLGASTATFMGLSGLGDLVLTCTGRYSRNRQAGIALGEGQRLEEFMEKTKLVVEGVYTTEVAWQLAQELEVDLPITHQVHRILFEGLAAKESLASIMTRAKKGEWPL